MPTLCTDIFNQYKKNEIESIDIENSRFNIHNSNKNVNRMPFNILLGIEPKLLIAFLGSIEIMNLQNLDYAIKIIPALAVTSFTIYKWVFLHRKNKKDEQ